MCLARCKLIAFVATVALALFFATPAAALRLGPAILGLAALPLHIITHGAHGLGVHHHAARALTAHASVGPERRAAHDRRITDRGPSTPAEPAAAPAASASPSPVDARGDTKRALAPARANPAVATAPTWPIASPTVYEDLLGYVLWPGDYADHLWTHGYGDIMNTVLATTAASGDQAASSIADGMCSATATELADRLIAHTRDTIAPSEAQEAALDELADAVREAIARGRAAVCTGAGDPLQRMVDALWTMWDATLLMRPPLERFYNSLTDAQKEKLAGQAGDALKHACGEQLQDAAPERLAQALGAGAEQRPTLQELQERSAALIKFLAASCPRGREATPIDRLAAAGERMNALLYAVMSMSPTVHALKQTRAQAEQQRKP
jgi:hypothetical protein